jgi:hypothetical protein
MNLDAPRPFVVLDGEVEIEKSPRSTFPIQYPRYGWSSRKGDFWAYCWGLLWNIFDMGRNSATIRSLQAMAILN